MNWNDNKQLKKHRLTIQLKACPFCGGNAQLDNTWTAHYWVECTSCEAQVADPAIEFLDHQNISHHRQSMNQAAVAWNTRLQ